MRRIVPLLIACLALVACSHRRDPPGAATGPTAAPRVVHADGDPLVHGADGGGHVSVKGEPGSVDDNLPFSPDGTKLASIAWRTWVYTDAGPQRTRLGYLRAGAVVDARGPAIKNDGCADGWYRINPRGFVCVGKGATLNVNDIVVVENSVRAVRGQGLPYLYARAADVAPLRYFKLPTKAEMEAVEGEGVIERAKRWRTTLAAAGVKDLLGDPGAPPDFLVGGKPVVKPYGVLKRLHFSVHSGRSAPDSGFAITRTFESDGRLFGLTTELDIIALDRTHIVKPSEFHGIELGEGETLPVGFVEQHYAQRFTLGPDNLPHPDGNLAWRQPIKLTGKTRAGGYWETRDGGWVLGSTMRIIMPRDQYPSVATGIRKWIDISIGQQSLVAYVGEKPVYVTLVSTGRGGMGDPEKVLATVRGTFMIHAKHVSTTMDGSDDKADSYNLLDVPFVQYFHKGYALHGTYWHDDFGKVRSHGCVNLAPIDSAWLFEWTDPPVPPGWHAAFNFERGTVVTIHG